MRDLPSADVDDGVGAAEAKGKDVVGAERMSEAFNKNSIYLIKEK